MLTLFRPRSPHVNGSATVNRIIPPKPPARVAPGKVPKQEDSSLVPTPAGTPSPISFPPAPPPPPPPPLAQREDIYMKSTHPYEYVPTAFDAFGDPQRPDSRNSQYTLAGSDFHPDEPEPVEPEAEQQTHSDSEGDKSPEPDINIGRGSLRARKRSRKQIEADEDADLLESQTTGPESPSEVQSHARSRRPRKQAKLKAT